MIELKPRQQRAYDYLLARKGKPQSMSTIARALGYATPQHAKLTLDKLEHAGLAKSKKVGIYRLYEVIEGGSNATQISDTHCRTTEADDADQRIMEVVGKYMAAHDGQGPSYEETFRLSGLHKQAFINRVALLETRGVLQKFKVGVIKTLVLKDPQHWAKAKRSSNNTPPLPGRATDLRSACAAAVTEQIGPLVASGELSVRRLARIEKALGLGPIEKESA